MGNLLTPLAIWFGRQDATRENSHLVVTLDPVSYTHLPLPTIPLV